MTTTAAERGTVAEPEERSPKAGDVIQTGMIYANGDGSIVWGTHQIVRWISSDGTLWFRPREAKVDKCSTYWRFPVESTEKIIKELKRWANPKEAKEAIARIQHPDEQAQPGNNNRME